jgi:hypothetical protein
MVLVSIVVSYIYIYIYIYIYTYCTLYVLLHAGIRTRSEDMYYHLSFLNNFTRSTATTTLLYNTTASLYKNNII